MQYGQLKCVIQNFVQLQTWKCCHQRQKLLSSMYTGHIFKQSYENLRYMLTRRLSTLLIMDCTLTRCLEYWFRSHYHQQYHLLPNDVFKWLSAFAQPCNTSMCNYVVAKLSWSIFCACNDDRDCTNERTRTTDVNVNIEDVEDNYTN